MKFKFLTWVVTCMVTWVVTSQPAEARCHHLLRHAFERVSFYLTLPVHMIADGYVNTMYQADVLDAIHELEDTPSGKEQQ